MGALKVLAEAEENSPIYESLRKAGFTAYGWEIAWKLPGRINSSTDIKEEWQTVSPADDPQLRSLYQSLVPPIVQAAEAYPNGGMRRLVFRLNGEIIAYVESSTGPSGLYLRPLIHPSAENISGMLIKLCNQFNDIGQPVYLQIRSYQAWLMDALQMLGGESSAQYTLLVKHLAILQRNGVIITNRKLVENRQAEPTAPIATNLAVDDPPRSH